MIYNKNDDRTESARGKIPLVEWLEMGRCEKKKNKKKNVQLFDGSAVFRGGEDTGVTPPRGNLFFFFCFTQY